ncbi:hypothetical protein ABK730_12920 [Klebsiella indica]|uniref:Uncharacterized protein n=1 Tax=Klebsiella indica TaxID=2582917 RepID=A0A5R9LKK8_9ENTR|nr:MULTISPECIES: hypothetical protein [Klebsiella]TLV20567.1 hypothetical protein FE839_07850 [Klebsiella indica]
MPKYEVKTGLARRPWIGGKIKRTFGYLLATFCLYRRADCGWCASYLYHRLYIVGDGFVLAIIQVAVAFLDIAVRIYLLGLIRVFFRNFIVFCVVL